jgi:hypothetical protein
LSSGGTTETGEQRHAYRSKDSALLRHANSRIPVFLELVHAASLSDVSSQAASLHHSAEP